MKARSGSARPGLRRPPWAALLSCTAILLPLANLLLQEALRIASGLELRTGPSALLMIGTGAVGVLGLLMLAVVLYVNRKAKQRSRLFEAFAWAVGLAFAMAVALVLMQGPDAYCSQAEGSCGRWN